MTMYLSNSDLRPTGSETTEFLDLPVMADAAGAANVNVERPDGTDSRLDTQTRLNITRWAEEYISGLVENHNGGPADVRSIIHELHDHAPFTDDEHTTR